MKWTSQTTENCCCTSLCGFKLPAPISDVTAGVWRCMTLFSAFYSTIPIYVFFCWFSITSCAAEHSSSGSWKVKAFKKGLNVCYQSRRVEKHQVLLLCMWHSVQFLCLLKCFNMAYCWQALINGTRGHAGSRGSFEETGMEEDQPGTPASLLRPQSAAPTHPAGHQSTYRLSL